MFLSVRIYYIMIGESSEKERNGSSVTLRISGNSTEFPFGVVHVWLNPPVHVSLTALDPQWACQSARRAAAPASTARLRLCSLASSASLSARLGFTKCAWDYAPAAAPRNNSQYPRIKLTRHKIKCIRVRGASTNRVCVHINSARKVRSICQVNTGVREDVSAMACSPQLNFYRHVSHILKHRAHHVLICFYLDPSGSACPPQRLSLLTLAKILGMSKSRS